MGSKGGQSSTSSNFGMSSQTTTPDPQAYAAYTNLLNRAQTVGEQPYVPYTGQLVQGFSPDQQAAFASVNGLQGVANPYIQQATGLAQFGATGANPMNYAQNLKAYQDPYVQQVVDATRANMQQNNAVQMNQLTGNAIAQGALGGSRVAATKANLARQQSLADNQTIAGLYDQGYRNAQGQLNAALGQAQQGAYGLGALGQEALTTGLTGAQAQLQTGGLQQQLGQAQLSTAYQQWLQAQRFPYSQLSWLSGIVNGTGPNMGGTTTGWSMSQGQQQQSGQSGAGSILGGLTSLIGALPLKDGGRVPKADGGPYGDGGLGFVPMPSGGLSGALPSLALLPTGGPQAGGLASASPVGSAAGTDQIPQERAAPAKGLNLPPLKVPSGGEGGGGKGGGGGGGGAPDLSKAMSAFGKKASSMFGGAGRPNGSSGASDPIDKQSAGNQFANIEGSDLSKGGPDYLDDKSNAFMGDDPAANFDSMNPSMDWFAGDGGMDMGGDMGGGFGDAGMDFGGMADMGGMDFGGFGFLGGLRRGGRVPRAGGGVLPTTGLLPGLGAAPGPEAGGDGQGDGLGKLADAIGKLTPAPANQSGLVGDAASSMAMGTTGGGGGYRAGGRIHRDDGGDVGGFDFAGVDPQWDGPTWEDTMAGPGPGFATEADQAGLGRLQGFDPDEFFRQRLVQQESKGSQFDRLGENPLRSGVGAVGASQVMPGTGPEAARLAGVPWDSNRYRGDRDYNLALGSAYYNNLYDRFGDPMQAAAAYNAGPGAVRAALARADRLGGDYRDYLPDETQGYLRGIAGNAPNMALGFAGGGRIHAADGLAATGDFGSFDTTDDSALAFDPKALKHDAGGFADAPLPSEKFAGAGDALDAADAELAGEKTRAKELPEQPTPGLAAHMKPFPYGDRDRDATIRTVLSEAGGKASPAAQAAVAEVIRNRTASGRWGDTPYQVVTAPYQFEPWQTRDNHPSRWNPESPEYQRAAAVVDSVFGGDSNTTGGATHFFAPGAQAALGRNVPKWARGEPLANVGGHLFYAPDGSVQVASAQGLQGASASPQSEVTAYAEPTSGKTALASATPTAAPAAAPAPAETGLGATIRKGLNAINPVSSANAQEASTGTGGTSGTSGTKGGGWLGLNLSPEVRQALMMAGFGMMASKAKHPGQQIGEGGMAGVQAYTQAMQNQNRRELTNAQVENIRSEIKTREQQQKLLELQMRARQAIADELGKGDTNPYGGGAPAGATAPAVPAGNAPVQLGKPTVGAVSPPRAPVAAPAPGGAPAAPAASPTAATAAPAGSAAPSVRLHPQTDPAYLDGQAARFERAAQAAMASDPDLAKGLLAQAQTYRQAANTQRTSPTAMDTQGNIIARPGFNEVTNAAAASKTSAEEEARQKVAAQYRLVDVQPEPGGPVYKVRESELLDGAHGGAGKLTGAGSPPGGTVQNGIVAKQPEFIQKQREEIAKNEVQMNEQFKKRQVAKERLQAIADLLKTYESGAFADVKAELIAKARAFGIPLQSTDTANPEAFQQFMKNATANVFDQAGALGGRILVAEIMGLREANANPKMQPEANRAILGQSLGIFNYEDQYYKDYMAWRRKNPYAIDTSAFDIAWTETHPLGEFTRQAKADTPVKGEPVPAYDQRKEGYVYMTPKGALRWTGVKGAEWAKP